MTCAQVTELEPPQIPASLDFTTDWLCDLRQVNKPLWASIALEWKVWEDLTSYFGTWPTADSHRDDDGGGDGSMRSICNFLLGHGKGSLLPPWQLPPPGSPSCLRLQSCASSLLEHPSNLSLPTEPRGPSAGALVANWIPQLPTWRPREEPGRLLGAGTKPCRTAPSVGRLRATTAWSSQRTSWPRVVQA